MGFSNLSKFPQMHFMDFKFWDAPSLTFPTHLGDTKSLVYIWAWSSIFILETVVTQISQLFMLQAPHTWFIVAQVRSFGEWLSIIARSELGSDLDCSVINTRSELGSDLDCCYELKFPFFSPPPHKLLWALIFEVDRAMGNYVFLIAIDPLEPLPTPWLSYGDMRWIIQALTPTSSLSSILL